MSDFMAELLKQAKDDPSKVTVKPVAAMVESKIESTRWEDGEKVKVETEVKSEKKEVETKFLGGRSLYLSFDAGCTLNLGNFNMGKVNVSLSMPVGTDVTPELIQKINSTYEFAKKYCETKLEAEVNELLKLRGKI